MEFEKFLYYLQVVCCLMLATIGVVAGAVGVFELLTSMRSGSIDSAAMTFEQWFPLVFGAICVIFSVKFRPQKLEL